MDTSVFLEVIQKYAQDLDPTALQVGQSVYDASGQEMIVIADPEDTTTKTLMPADQQGVSIPQGVTDVEEGELASQYSVQESDGMAATGPITAFNIFYEYALKG